MVKLFDVAKVKGGKRLPKGANFSDVPTRFPYIRVVDFQDGSIALSRLKYLTPEVQRRIKRYTISKEDVYISIAGTIGLVGTVPEMLDGANLTENAAKLVLTQSSTLDKDFLALYLSSEPGQNEINSLTTKTTQPKLALNRIEQILVPQLPLGQQRAIVRTLQTVKGANGARRRELSLECERKAALIEYLYAHGTRGGPTKQTEIGEIPKGWTVEALGAVAKLVSGGTPSRANADWWKGVIPWASPKDMKRVRLVDTQEHISEDAVEAGSRLVPSRTIFIVIRGMILAKETPIGLTEVPMAFNQDMKAILPHERLHPEFLLYALIWRKDGLAKHIGTSAHGTRRLSSTAVASLLVPVPPFDEQNEIAELLNSCDTKIDALEKEIPLHEELFRAMSQELMTGRLSMTLLNEQYQGR